MSVVNFLLIQLLALAPAKIIQPLSHHALLLLLLQLALLLLTARGLGELMRRVNQPPVVGELLAGVLLGPSVFGLLLGPLQAQIFPADQTQANILSAEAWLGVLFLLVVTGLETDLNLIVRKGKTALMVSLGGILVPFLSGFGLGMWLPDDFLIEPSERFVFSLFIATAMSISAVPVIAKVLMDLKLIRRDIGQIILAAGMTDDTIGWILLSVVSGLVTSGSFNVFSLVKSAASALIFIGLALWLGRPLVNRIFAWVDNHIGGATASLTTLIVLALGAAAITHALGIEAVLGAFMIGILAAQSRRFDRQAGHALEMITAGFLAPIFFASAGLKVNLLQLLNPRIFGVGLIVLAIACLGKFVGAYGGSRLARLSHWEGLSLGAGMNARGAMEIIVATIGLSLGVLNPQMYSIIVMVAIATSLMAPSLLRWTLSHVEISVEEANRLRQEKENSQSFVHQIQRILIPSRGGANIQIAAQLVGFLAEHQPINTTVLYVAESEAANSHDKTRKVNRSLRDENTRAAQAAFSNVSAFIENAGTTVRKNGDAQSSVKKAVKSTLKTAVGYGRDRAAVILKESHRGYDLVVMGASEKRGFSDSLFNVLVDRVVQEAPCATLVVKSNLPTADGEFCDLTARPIRHIVVPTAGSQASFKAIEMASVIAAQTGAVITLVYVVNRPQVAYSLLNQQVQEPILEIAREILDYQSTIGQRLGAEVRSEVLTGNSPEATILQYANHNNADLIMLGSTLRFMTGRAFFGHRIDALLAQANCPVAVISVQ